MSIIPVGLVILLIPSPASWGLVQTNYSIKTMTDSNVASEASFNDPCYSPELVEFINYVLGREDLDAPAQWFAICEAEHTYYSPASELFQGLPHQLMLETAPREQLLSLIRSKRTRGYESLMDRFGVTY